MIEKPSSEEGVDPITGSSPRRSGLPRRRMLCRCEAQAQARGPLKFTEAKTNLHRGKDVRKGEATLHRGEGRKQQKTTLRFASAKDVFLAHLWPIFHLRINICILDLMRVWFWKENTLLRLSPLFFLIHSRVFDFVPFYFGFGANIEDLAH